MRSYRGRVVHVLCVLIKGLPSVLYTRSCPILNFPGVWDGSGEPQWGRGTLNGTSAGAFLEIAEIDATVEMTVAISFVSMAQARRNLNVQVGVVRW